MLVSEGMGRRPSVCGRSVSPRNVPDPVVGGRYKPNNNTITRAGVLTARFALRFWQKVHQGRKDTGGEMPIETVGSTGATTDVPAGIQVEFEIREATFTGDGGKFGP